MTTAIEHAKQRESERKRIMHLVDTTVLLLMSGLSSERTASTLTERYGVPRYRANALVAGMQRLIEQ